MFIIVLNNEVKFGPENWNKFIFEAILREECNINVNLPIQNKNFIEVNNFCKIYPVKSVDMESYNENFDLMEGPIWTFNDTYAEYTYNRIDRPLQEIKNIFKNKITEKRWKREIQGTSVTINNKDFFVSTKREERDIFLKKYLVLNENETTQWKFSEEWTELTKANLKTINDSINSYVEQQFVWEKTKHDEIDNCQSVEEIKTFIQNEQI